MKVKKGQIVLLVGLTIFAVVCLLPVLLVLIASFTDEKVLLMNGFSFFPEKWSLTGWKYLWEMKEQLLDSYKVTIFVTLFYTATSLFIESMLAYGLARTTFKLRGFLTGMVLFTMLFGGGMLSEYLVNTQMYHLKDTIWAICLPRVTALNVIMMRTYIKNNISDALIESAKIDGAKEFRIYRQICVPLMPPMFAALGFMMAIGKWNEWQGAMMYISSPKKTPLQLLLMRIQNNLDIMKSGKLSSEAMAAISGSIPSESVRMAMLFTVLGPVMIAYPFFQKYFIKGLTLGAVKG